MDCRPPGSSVHGDSPGKNIGLGCHALLQESLPDPGIEPVSLTCPALAGGFFTISAPGKPDSTVITSSKFGKHLNVTYFPVCI